MDSTTAAVSTSAFNARTHPALEANGHFQPLLVGENIEHAHPGAVDPET